MANLIEGMYATGEGAFHVGDTTPVASAVSSDSEQDFIDPALLQPGSPLPPAPTLSTPSPTVTNLAAPSNAMTSAKRIRNGHKRSGSSAIDGAVSINHLANAISADTAVVTIASPACKCAAIYAIEDDEQIQVYKIIRHDTSFADALLAIRKKEACTRFIMSELYQDDTD